MQWMAKFHGEGCLTSGKTDLGRKILALRFWSVQVDGGIDTDAIELEGRVVKRTIKGDYEFGMASEIIR